MSQYIKCFNELSNKNVDLVGEKFFFRRDVSKPYSRRHTYTHWFAIYI